MTPLASESGKNWGFSWRREARVQVGAAGGWGKINAVKSLQNSRQSSTLEAMRKNAYDAAKEHGGRHHNWYREQKNNGHRQLRKAIVSFQKRIAEHSSWLEHPENKVKDWTGRDVRYQNGLLNHWRNDIERHHEFIEILQGVLNEKGYTNEQFIQDRIDRTD